MTHATLKGAAGHYPKAMLGPVMASAGFPRAFLNSRPDGLPAIRAAVPDPGKVLADLTKSVADFQDRQDARFGEMQAAYDGIQKQLAANSINPGVLDSTVPPDPEYSRIFATYARRGHNESELDAASRTGERAIIRAAMSTGSNSDGGYVAPVEWDRRISKALRSESALRTLCRVVTTTTAGYSTLWNNSAWGSGWVGETANRPQTTTPNLSPITFKTGELYAQPAITQQLLEDSQINLEDWTALEVADEFNRQESIAFVSGDGVNKPQGFLSYVGSGTTLHPGGEPGVTPSGSASAVTGDGLVSLVYGLAAPYRANASFLMNSSTIAAVTKLKDGQGNYLWQPSFILGQPPTLLGKPVYFDEAMPNPTAGSLPIAFGDWSRFYVINDRLGTTVLRDQYTAKPYVLFYTRKRVGGGIADPNAVRFLKIAAS